MIYNSEGEQIMEKRLQDLTDVELKALAYDQLAQLQQCQNNLNVINGELSRRTQTSQPNAQVIPRLGATETV